MPKQSYQKLILQISVLLLPEEDCYTRSPPLTESYKVLQSLTKRKESHPVGRSSVDNTVPSPLILFSLFFSSPLILFLLLFIVSSYYFSPLILFLLLFFFSSYLFSPLILFLLLFVFSSYSFSPFSFHLLSHPFTSLS